MLHLNNDWLLFKNADIADFNFWCEFGQLRSNFETILVDYMLSWALEC